MNRLMRLTAISLSLLAIGCSGESAPINKGASTPDSQLERDRLFISEMIVRFDKPGMTGVSMLRTAYGYCTDLVEGATLDDLYSRIELLDDDEKLVRGAILDLAINVICPS